MRFTLLFIFLTSGLIACASSSPNLPPPTPANDSAFPQGLPNLNRPLPNLYTSGQPTLEGLRNAKKQGITTIVNLRGSEEEGSEGAEIVESLGLRYVAIPISGPEQLSVLKARQLAELLEDLEPQAILVHCKSGNRAGALLALKAYHLDGVSVEQAMELGRQGGMTTLENKVRDLLRDTPKP